MNMFQQGWLRSREDTELTESAASNLMIIRAVSWAFLIVILCTSIAVAQANRLSSTDLIFTLTVSVALGLCSIVAKNSRAIFVASHLLVISLITFVYGVCFLNKGIVSAPIVCIPFIPALCAKLFQRKTFLAYTCFTVIGLFFLLYVSTEGTFRTPRPSEYLYVVWLSTVSICTAFISLYIVRRSINLSKSLKYQSEQDFLTGLPNRYKIHEQLFQDIARANRAGSFAAVMMIDVDHFKDYNDRNGHMAGDTALVKVANRLKKIAIEKNGFVGRHGGEEFIFSIINPDYTEFSDIAEKLRQSISEMRIDISPSRSESLTITIGLATNLREPEIDYETLIQNADQALYKGKDRGRNRVEIFEREIKLFDSTSFNTAHRASKSPARIKPRNPRSPDLIDEK